MFGLGSEYNYQEFTKSVLAKDLASSRMPDGPRPGQRAPEFELRSLEGDLFRMKDFRAEKNVVITFGSATCPMTAGSIGGMNKLWQEFGDETQFVLIYVREAHPGDKIPSHNTVGDKIRAAEILRREEDVEMPILIDDLKGTVHRKYGKLPNSTTIIDKSGRVAFRAQWTEPHVVREALEQLLAIEHDRNTEHAVVLGGEDKSMPMSYPALYSYRALHRGGRRAIVDFERALGLPGKMAVASSRIIGPVAENPGRTLVAAALGAAVLTGGIYAGRALRRKRMASREPYQHYEPSAAENETDDYGVVGI